MYDQLAFINLAYKFSLKFLSKVALSNSEVIVKYEIYDFFCDIHLGM